MYIIKNRINGEYDRRGTHNTFDKVKRGAWDKLSHAKCHVLNVLMSGYQVRPKAFDWYIDADFIEINEDGVSKITPVIDYLRIYFSNGFTVHRLNEDQIGKIWNGGEIK